MIKIVTILYKNDNEVKELFDNLQQHLDHFEFIISMNSVPINRMTSNSVLYIGDGKNVGFGSALNRIIPVVEDEDILIFMNSDARISKINIDRLLNKVQSNHIVGPKCVANNLHVQDTFRRDVTLGRLIRRVFFRVFKGVGGSVNFEYPWVPERQVDWVIGGVFVIKSSCFKKLNGFDERYFMYLEDHDICLRARKTGMKILYSDCLVCDYAADRKSINIRSLGNLKLFVIHLISFVKFMFIHYKLFFFKK